MKNFFKWLKSLVSKLQKLKDKYIPVSVKIVQAVKAAINSGTLSIVIDGFKLLLPTAGDIALDQFEKYLIRRIPALCVQLEIINAVNLSDKSEEAIKQALNALSETYGEKWDEFMSGLAGDLANYLSDHVLDSKEAKKLAGKFYDEYIKKLEL
jgi:hypothetical protein